MDDRQQITSRQIVEKLRERFKDIIDHLEDVESTGRVTGFIVSVEFDDLDHKQRQDMLWQVLEDNFLPQELTDVGPILTLTPTDAELKAANSD